MQLTSSRVLTLTFLAATTTFIACGSDPIVPTDADVKDGSVDAPVAKADGGVDAAKETGPTQCVDHCTTNADCMNSCPSSGSGSHCCDQGTGKCYAFTAAACPADQPPPGDGGVTPPY